MKRSVLSYVAFLLLSVAIFNTTAASEWEAVDVDDAKIVFRGPNLGDGQFFKRSSSHDYQEYGTWSAGSRCPRAEVFLYQLWPDYIFARSQDVSTIVGMWRFFEGKNPKFSAEQNAINALGRVNFKLFAMNVPLHCVAFAQYFGTGSGFPNDQGIPPNIISGYYCDREPLPESTVEAVIQGIKVKGYKGKYQALISTVCETDSHVPEDRGTRTPQGAISESFFKKIDASRKRGSFKGKK